MSVKSEQAGVEKMRQQWEQRRGEPVTFFSNTSVHPLSRLHPERLFLESKCQMSKRQKVWCRRVFTNISTEAHVPTSTWYAGALPYAGTHPYHPSSGSHGQLFCPYGGSSAWHTHQVYEQANPRITDPLLPRVVRAKHSFKC